ncbi:hypothetical protein OG239_00350 [Streptomyces sp. NBC_00868]|nr:hypothetical protein OG239_00350 [Streptomyces sp. NBC_00868]
MAARQPADSGLLGLLAPFLSEFERIALYSVAELPDREYPPAGHDYPRP